MECLSPTSSTPLIIQPDSSTRWAEQQHIIMSEQLLVSKPFLAKEPPAEQAATTASLPLCRGNQADMHHVVKKRRTGAPTPSSSGIQKRQSHSNAKSRKQWEDLLRSSVAGLQGLYDRIEARAPPPPTSQPLGKRLRGPSVDDMVRMSSEKMISRAMQAAAGAGGTRPRREIGQDEEEDYWTASSGTEDSSYDTDGDLPATPNA